MPLRAPETLSSLSKSRISIFNAHLALFVHSMTSHNSIGKYRHLVNWLWSLPWNGTSPLADKTSRIIAEFERNECAELRFRRGLPLACWVICFVSSSCSCYMWPALGKGTYSRKQWFFSISVVVRRNVLLFVIQKKLFWLNGIYNSLPTLTPNFSNWTPF